jgi:hypothetical protein
MDLNNFTCKDPNDPANADLYVHKSSFDEVKEEGGNNSPVTVLTLANIYRLDCYYTKIPGNIVKSMSIVYQVSSTIVYTRELNPQILHAMDMQKIPLGFLPDLPEVLTDDKIPAVLRDNPYDPSAPPAPQERRKPTAEAKQAAETALPLLEERRRSARSRLRALGGGAPRKGELYQREREHRANLASKDNLVQGQLRNKISKDISLLQLGTELQTALGGIPPAILLYSFLSSGYTSCATHRRIASYGAFFAGKMMEYFFNEYIQLPSFFKYFEIYLKHCFQYSTTALIYDANVPPYNLITIPPGSSFTLQFFLHFQKMGISFAAGVAPNDISNQNYIGEKLQEKTAYITAISNFLTKDFMIDEGATDNIQAAIQVDVDRNSVYSGSTHTTQSKASVSTSSSTRSEIFCSFDLEDITNSDALCVFLLETPLEKSKCGDDDYQGLISDEDDDEDDDDEDDEDDDEDDDDEDEDPMDGRPQQEEPQQPQQPQSKKNRVTGGGNKPRLATVATTKRNRKYKTRSSPKRKSKSKSRHKRNSKLTNKTFCRKRKSYLSRKPHKKQTLKKGVKR